MSKNGFEMSKSSPKSDSFDPKQKVFKIDPCTKMIPEHSKELGLIWKATVISRLHGQSNPSMFIENRHCMEEKQAPKVTTIKIHIVQNEDSWCKNDCPKFITSCIDLKIITHKLDIRVNLKREHLTSIFALLLTSLLNYTWEELGLIIDCSIVGHGLGALVEGVGVMMSMENSDTRLL